LDCEERQAPHLEVRIVSKTDEMGGSSLSWKEGDV
jgi:hypothetical protein